MCSSQFRYKLDLCHGVLQILGKGEKKFELSEPAFLYHSFCFILLLATVRGRERVGQSILKKPNPMIWSWAELHAVVIDVVVSSDSNIRNEKLEKHQGLKEDLQRMRKVKAKVVPAVVRACGTVTPMLREETSASESF